MKRITDPQEIHKLANMVRDGTCEAEWKTKLDSLSISQAALLPGSTEAEGRFRRFDLFPRMTSHVRHKAKYMDVELIEGQAFVFTNEDGSWAGAPARSLKEFCVSLKNYPLQVLARHAERGDFSEWIEEVFHDHLLGSQMRKIEQRQKAGHERNLADSLLKAVNERYEFSSNGAAGTRSVTAASDEHHSPELTVSVT